MLIDLDVVPPGPAEQRASADRSSRWLAFALALVGAFWLAAAAIPGRSLAPLWIVGGDFDGVVVDERQAYTLRFHQGATLVEAYRLEDGRRAWSFDEFGLAFVAVVDRATLILATGSAVAPLTIALDVRSGEVRWRAPVLVLGRAGDLVVASDPAQWRLAGLAIDTGTPRWQVELAAGSAVAGERDEARPAGDGRLTEVADLAPDGALRLRDPATGAQRRQLSVEPPGPLRAPAFLVDGAFVIAETEQDSSYWYDTRTAQLARLPSLGYLIVTDVRRCGTWICVGNNGGLTAFDRRTGRRVWHVDGWNIFRPLEGRLALVFDVTGVEEGFVGALIDPSDGRVVDALDGWQPIDATYGRSVLLWHRMSAGGMLVAMRDARTGAHVVVGRASRWFVAPLCQVNRRYLVCASDGLAIWRLPGG